MRGIEGEFDRRAQHFNLFKDVLGTGDPFEGSPISQSLSFGNTGATQNQQYAAQQQQMAAAQTDNTMVYAGVGIAFVLVLAVAMKGDTKRRR